MDIRVKQTERTQSIADRILAYLIQTDQRPSEVAIMYSLDDPEDFTLIKKHREDDWCKWDHAP